MSPTAKPGAAADAIFVSLYNHARRTGDGRAVGDNKGFVVTLPHRESSSPDAGYWVGDDPGMKFYAGVPIFAVGVRSENDYGLATEREVATKRADYFAAGTPMVWDVDLLSEDVARVYRASNPDALVVYGRGETAEAEPLVPGWSILAHDLFPN